MTAALPTWGAMTTAADVGSTGMAIAQLEQAYCLRSLLERVAGLVVTAVALEAGKVVLVLPEPLPAAWQPYVQCLGSDSVEVRLVGDLPQCRSLDGDHCNSDYDRS